MKEVCCLVSLGRSTVAGYVIAESDDRAELLVSLNGTAFQLKASDVIQLPGLNLANLSFESSRA